MYQRKKNYITEQLLQKKEEGMIEGKKKQDKQTPKNAAVNEKKESPKPSHSHTYKKHAFDLV